MAHNATHVSSRDWCPICVVSRGRSSLHRRVVVNKDTLLKFQTDFMFIRTVAENKTQPCITFKETRSGVVISLMCARKGGYEELTKEILRRFESYGFLGNHPTCILLGSKAAFDVATPRNVKIRIPSTQNPTTYAFKKYDLTKSSNWKS